VVGAAAKEERRALAAVFGGFEQGSLFGPGLQLHAGAFVFRAEIVACVSTNVKTRAEIVLS
jgi:hypothetical protein